MDPLASSMALGNSLSYLGFFLRLHPGPWFHDPVLTLSILLARLCPQTPCQQELDQVLERISTMRLPDERGPLEHLYSLHIPNCDKHGLYNLKQVSEALWPCLAPILPLEVSELSRRPSLHEPGVGMSAARPGRVRVGLVSWLQAPRRLTPLTWLPGGSAGVQDGREPPGKGMGALHQGVLTSVEH